MDRKKLLTEIEELSRAVTRLERQAERSDRPLTAAESALRAELLGSIAGLRKELPDEPIIGMRASNLADGGATRYGVTDTGQRVRFYARGESLASAYATDHEAAHWSLGDYVAAGLGRTVRAAVGEDAVPRGPATVPLQIGAQIIDAVRAKSRIMQAGASTIPITAPTNLCRIATDPVVYEHEEGTSDITESQPVFEPVALDPGSLAALIPVSAELLADSPNADAALRTAIAGAFAAKVDSLGVAALLADTDIPDSGSSHVTDAWAGVIAALGADQDVPKALICNPADYAARAGELATDAGTWLGAPPVLREMLDLPTSTMTVGHAVFGDFAAGVALASRMPLSVELIRWGKPTAGSHLLVAYARLAVVVLQPEVLFHQIDTVG